MLVSEAALESYEEILVALGVVNIYAGDVLLQSILKRQLFLEGIIQQAAKRPILMIISDTTIHTTCLCVSYKSRSN